MELSEAVLKTFVKELAEANGALVEEIEPNSLEIISPSKLQEKLRLPELSLLGFALEKPKGAERVGLETEWLERLGGALGQKGQFLRSIIPVNMQTPSNPERILEHNLTLQNAVYRFIKVTPAWTRYLIFIFHYTAFSDEKRDGILRVGLNLSNGGLIDNFIDTLMREFLIYSNNNLLLDESMRLPLLWNEKQLDYFLKHTLPRAIETNLSQFLAGLKRRQERDLLRIYDYHRELRRESLLRIKKQPAETEKEQAKIQAITREYQTKIVDLQQKYDLRIDVKWVQTLEVITQVQRFEILIKRRKGERNFHLDWNPLAKKLESAPCEYSFNIEGKRIVCDDALHIVSEFAHKNCSYCTKAYCRACHPLKCPKCGKSKA